MAKLRKPDLPTGPRRQLSEALHDLHRCAGWPAVRELERRIGSNGLASKSRIHGAFSQDRLPAWGLVELIVRELALLIPGTDPEIEVPRFHRLWDEEGIERALTPASQV